MRFLPLQRFPTRSSGLICTSLPHSNYQRPQVLSTSRRLTAPSLPALFHARSALGVFPPEPFSSSAAVRRLRRPYPHAVQHPCIPGGTRKSKDHRAQPVQQKPSTPGSCSTLEFATHSQCIRPTGARSSPGILPSRVHTVDRMARLSPRLPS
jgi:hypothetical protein